MVIYYSQHGRTDVQACGSVGIGRRARLRILWQQCRVGSSPIFRIWLSGLRTWWILSFQSFSCDSPFFMVLAFSFSFLSVFRSFSRSHPLTAHAFTTSGLMPPFSCAYFLILDAFAYRVKESPSATTSVGACITPYFCASSAFSWASTGI